MKISASEWKQLAGNKRENKYGNQKIKSKEGTFDSKGEWERWKYLVCLRGDGEITDLERQVEHKIEINGMLVCKYIADAVYKFDGRTIVEDFKGVRTGVFNLKKKLMLAVHGIDVKVVRSPTRHPKDL